MQKQKNTWNLSLSNCKPHPTQVNKKTVFRLTDNHKRKLKAPLHRLPVHLVGEVGEADITLQIPLLKENTDLLHIPLIKEHNGFSITVIPV